MFHYFKQGFGVALGMMAGIAVVGAMTNGLKIDISKFKKEAKAD